MGLNSHKEVMCIDVNSVMYVAPCIMCEVCKLSLLRCNNYHFHLFLFVLPKQKPTCLALVGSVINRSHIVW